MKWLIRKILNLFPRTLLQRVAEWMVPLVGLLYIGRGKECPICGCRRRKFLPYGYVESRENALCPSCLALERHRLLWLYLEREGEIQKNLPSILHIAPEVAIMRKMRSLYKDCRERYVTADLESPLSDLHFDVQSIPLESNSVECVICNHIMEHIEDDRLAMREIYRIMKPSGWGIILSPIDYSRATTFEDDTITDPKERTKIFGQYDHRRIYGTDYADRLREAGFTVDEIDFASTLSEDEFTKFALTHEIIYRVSKL